MDIPILSSKLYIPRPRTKAVPRPRLIERLNEGLDGKLTLVSASAGFGKTTLVAEWVAGCGRPAAWLSLDEGDDDYVRLLLHLVAALRTIAPSVGEGVLAGLRFSKPPSAETLLTMLLGEIAALPDPILLVLDDYHLIGAGRIDEALTFFVDHLPPALHLVIATRETPRLPLGRLRGQGELTELRAADLRFSSEEAAAFLDGATGRRLTSDEAAALEARTEGWIAGLQLAALSMQGRDDIPAFVRAFAGDHRFIMDYLAEEVLLRQPEPVRSFLLRTSILTRLHGSLCDAVAGSEGGGARLELLERGNFFVVPLDDRRRWYRYHHLFAEVLSAHLRETEPDRIGELHRRASAWYERHGSADDAIRHALAAGDAERAADMIERAWPDLRRNRQGRTALRWLKALPDEAIRRRPVLSVEYAWASLAGGQIEAAEARLREAEYWLDVSADGREGTSAPKVGMVVADEEEYRRLPGTIAGYRAALAQAKGDIPSAVRYARQVLELVPDDDPLRRGAAAALLGLASWTSGELEAAHRMFADGMANVLRAGNVSDAISGVVALADIRIAQGRLRQAMRTLEEGVRLASEHGGGVQGTADLYVSMSELCREHNDLDAAERHLRRSEELGERTGFPPNGSRRRIATAKIREARGDPDGALDLLREAERMGGGGFFPDVRPAAALQARVWLSQGRAEEALEWARAQRVNVDDDLTYLREFEHITLARTLLVRWRIERTDRFMTEATELLNRLLREAEEGGRRGSAIEIAILQALAHQSRGDVPAALAPLERALRLAEPEGYARVFADEGKPMAALLEAAAMRGIVPNYARRLLAAFREGELTTEPASTAEPPREALSERERGVLRLLGTDLSGPDIARELSVSLNTLRTHTKHIYDKLQVNSRRAAVRRAKELGLV